MEANSINSKLQGSYKVRELELRIELLEYKGHQQMQEVIEASLSSNKLEEVDYEGNE